MNALAPLLSVQLHALPLCRCSKMPSLPVGQIFQVFFTSGGKRKCEGVCPLNSSYSWATTVSPCGKHQPALVRMYKLSKSSSIVKVKTNHWTNYKKKIDDTEGLSLTSNMKFKLMCTSSLHWSWVKRSAKISGKTKFSDHLFKELQMKNKSSCRKCQQLKLQVLRKFPVW